MKKLILATMIAGFSGFASAESLNEVCQKIMNELPGKAVMTLTFGATGPSTSDVADDLGIGMNLSANTIITSLDTNILGIINTDNKEAGSMMAEFKNQGDNCEMITTKDGVQDHLLASELNTAKKSYTFKTISGEVTLSFQK